jgi:parallel beta-helix repeat protein
MTRRGKTDRRTGAATLPAEALEPRRLLATYWVDSAGSNANAGTQSAPFQTITYALTRATAVGDVVNVNSGTYRGEKAWFKGHGVTLQAAPGAPAKPEITGLSVLPSSGWVRQDPAGQGRPIYSAPWNHFFGAWASQFTDPNGLGNNESLSASMRSGRTDSDARYKARNQLFVDRAYQVEVARLIDLAPGKFFIDDAANKVHLWLSDGGAPASHVVEGTTRGESLVRTQGYDNLTIRNLIFFGGANQHREPALLRVSNPDHDTANKSDNVLIDGVEAYYAAGSGIFVNGTGGTVRNIKVSNNGECGILAGGPRSYLIENVELFSNNKLVGKVFDLGDSAVAKVTSSRDTTVQNVVSAYNNGNGFWFDGDNRNVIFRNSRIHDNNNEGLRYELAYTANIYNNVIYRNKSIGIHLSASSGANVFNNTIAGEGDLAIAGAQTRYWTQYGKHQKVYANKIYNNLIFYQQMGYNKKGFGLAYNVVDPQFNPAGFPDSNGVVPFAQNDSNNNLFYLATGADSLNFFVKSAAGSDGSFATTSYKTLAEFLSVTVGQAWDTNSLWKQNPLFVSAAVDDYRLMQGSPADNRGVIFPGMPSFALVDAAGRRRSAGNVDIGAYQVNAPPSVATPAAASSARVTGRTTALSILGSDDTGEPALTYRWSATGPAPVTFSANGSNTARHTLVTFAEPGAYRFTATITDAEGLAVSSTVDVTVDLTVTRIDVTPDAVTVGTGASQQFTARAADQFGRAMATAFTWQVSSGGGAIDSSGLYTAPADPGSATIMARSGDIAGSAAVTIVDRTAPVLVTAASRKTHGSAGAFDLALSLDSATPTVEPRVGGPSRLLFTLSEAVTAADGTLDSSEFTIDNAAFAAASMAGDVLTLQLANAVNGTRVSVSLNGLIDAAGNALTGTRTITIRSLYGDVIPDGVVNLSDLQAVKDRQRQTASFSSFRFDVDGDGLIDLDDLQVVKNAQRTSVP